MNTASAAVKKKGAPRTRSSRLLSVLLPLTALLALGGCSDDPTGSREEEVIDRETFISAYVDLRVAALTRMSGELHPNERTRILEEHGVTEDDLLRFVEVRGRDVHFMQEVWDEVRNRLSHLEEEMAPGSS